MPDSPVFVDLTGRRRRRVRMAALTAVALLLGTVALVVVALLGVPIGPAAFLPDPETPAPQATPQAPERDGEPAEEPVTSTTGRRPAPRTATDSGPGDASGTDPATTITSFSTTTHTKGKPETPPGRPTDLSTPPGRTR